MCQDRDDSVCLYSEGISQVFDCPRHDIVISSCLLFQKINNKYNIQTAVASLYSNIQKDYKYVDNIIFYYI